MNKYKKFFDELRKGLLEVSHMDEVTVSYRNKELVIKYYDQSFEDTLPDECFEHGRPSIDSYRYFIYGINDDTAKVVIDKEKKRFEIETKCWILREKLDKIKDEVKDLFFYLGVDVNYSVETKILTVSYYDKFLNNYSIQDFHEYKLDDFEPEDIYNKEKERLSHWRDDEKETNSIDNLTEEETKEFVDVLFK